MSQIYLIALLAAPLLLGSFDPAAAQSPEAIEEERALGVVKAIQAGDATALEQYMHENWVPAEPGSDREARWPGVTKMLTERHADIEITGVAIDQPHYLTIITSAPDGPELRFVFEFSSEPPHLVVSMGVEAGPPSSSGDFPSLEFADGANADQVSAVLTNWFDKLATADAFSGAALVAWRGETIFSGAWGLADRRWNISNRLDTRFDLGSINKSFTKIAIGQLLSRGKLSLDDPISTYLPDYPNREAADKITVRHLVEHTSGLGDIFTEEYFNSSKALYRTPRDFFPLFAGQPLNSEPGEKHAYSNAGFMVLGVIIAEVSGEAYDEYIVRHIFEPAGMTRSGFFPRDEPVPDIAVGYTRHAPGLPEGELRTNRFLMAVKGSSAGNAQSTVADLLRFDNALRDYQLLAPGYTDWYFGGTEPVSETPTDPATERAAAGIGIAGGAPGINAVLESDGKLTVIVLVNYDPPLAEQVGRQLFRPVKQVLGVTEP